MYTSLTLAFVSESSQEGYNDGKEYLPKHWKSS